MECGPCYNDTTYLNVVLESGINVNVGERGRAICSMGTKETEQIPQSNNEVRTTSIKKIQTEKTHEITMKDMMEGCGHTHMMRPGTFHLLRIRD